MNRKLKVSALLLILTLFFIECEHSPNDIVDIPDENFLNTLILKYVDDNGNGLISYAEAKSVTKLSIYSVYSPKIIDLTGIEAFINLERLEVNGTRITSLDLSNSKQLTKLMCSGNQLTSLDVSNSTALEDLFCSNNQLTSLDVSGCNELFYLSCSNNQLTSLDVSKNSGLEFLLCGNNIFSNLDLSKNIRLGSSSRFSSSWTVCSELSLANMPSLTEVCVSESFNVIYGCCVNRAPDTEESVCASLGGSPNAYFSTECTNGTNS